MKTIKKLLITGGTGLLGKGMEETAPKDVQIRSLHQREYTVESSKAHHAVLDIRDKQKVDRLFDDEEFDIVIHAAGIASVDYVERHYAESLESNIVGTLNITSAARKKGCHLVYVSTNAVFDGTQAPYKETDALGPVNKYGSLKAECERLVIETLERYTIVRPILMYGWNHSVSRPNPSTWVFEKLLRGESIEMVTDVYENPLYNIQCADALWEIVKRKPSGVFHLAGGEIVNRYEFALKVAQVFDLDASLIRAVDSTFFPSIAARPKNTSFDTRRMESELGVTALSVEEGLRDMKRRMKVKG
jgi:dTDP-4-dehydrorhamnose reductase